MYPVIVSQNPSIQPRNYFPFQTLTGVSALVVAGLMIVKMAGTVDLKMFDNVGQPISAAIVICAAGIGSFYLLHRKFSLFVFSADSFRRGLPVAMALAIPFMVSVTAADIAFRFPIDVNVPLPAALIFYPAIGYVAQIALHIVPFTILLLLLRLFLPAGNPNRQMWAGILLSSVPEAVFQTVFAVNGQGSYGIAAFVTISLFFFGVVELNLLRRYDFATMYAFRFMYYCYWHLAWGNVRLHWLF